LVRFSEYPEFVLDGGYPLEGPLSRSRVLELEPLSNWENRNAASECDNSLGFTFFFPDEGCVDPSATVRALRQAAQKLGVKFQCEQNVTNITYDDENGTVVSVESCPCNTKRSPPTTLISTPADLVVSAAGCGISAPFLGGVPLLNRPGRIEYAAKKTNNQKVEGKWLRRILVDAQRSSHVLQRSNGDIVAGGGGRLEFGGSTSTIPVDAPEEIELDDGELKAPKILSLLDLALELAPSALEGLRSHKVCHAVRPMPQDGLPVVGFQGSGLYVAITHSGVTLGPLLGSMVAAEITESLSLEILEPYRPTRFSPVQR
jgi:D-hydroxyproline dehydrogenase subunit beta